MIGSLRGIRAIAILTGRELQRQHLWTVFAVIAVGFLIALPRLQAVDDTARLKLSVLSITSSIGFVATLLAILAAAMTLRRDLEARTGYTLFAKPLRPSAYLLGRWLGSTTWIGIGVTLLCLAGTLAVALQFRALPKPRTTYAPVAWQQVSAVGEVTDIEAKRDRFRLSGLPGNGLRWEYSHLPASAEPIGHEFLICAQVTGATADQPTGEALIEVRALVGDRTIVLPLDEHSPYGQNAGQNAAGRVVLKHRDNASRDLGQDYLRLRLPPEAVSADGRATIQLTRLESRVMIIVEQKSGALIGDRAGGLAGNLMRGGLVLTAACGLLAAAALAVAVVSNLGVSLLAGLTLFFAGSAHEVVRDTLAWENPSLVVRRLLELVLRIVPDFHHFPVATDLASGRSIPWGTVLDAWLYFGFYTVPILGLGWLALRRTELR